MTTVYLYYNQIPRKKLLHPIFVSLIKKYLLTGKINFINLFNKIDSEMNILKNNTNCSACNFKLDETWKTCELCTNIICNRCIVCKSCMYKHSGFRSQVDNYCNICKRFSQDNIIHKCYNFEKIANNNLY